MGAINLDNTGSGGAITLSSDGTSLLLGGSAVGGGADLYAANESSPTAQPSATGNNAIAIGDSAVASGGRSIALGHDAAASGSYATAIGAGQFGNGALAVSGGSIAIGESYSANAESTAIQISTTSTSYGATGANSIAMGYQAKATGIGDINIGYEGYATGSTGAVAIGFRARATGSSAICLGQSGYSNASGTAAVCIGYDVDASGLHAVSFGREITNTKDYSFVVGRRIKNDITDGKYVNGISRFADPGDGQSGKFILLSDTTDATAEAMTTDNTTADTENQIVLPNNSAYSFHGTIVARESAASGTDCAAWKVEGLIRREGSAGTTVLVNSATTVLDNTPSWGMALSADTTNGGLKVEVTGAAATNIRWVGTIHTSEVTYA